MPTRAQQDEIDFYYKHRGAQAQRTREIAGFAQRGKDSQPRDAMVDCVWFGLREAVNRAPDLFPGLDTKALAAQVVDELILGGRG